MSNHEKRRVYFKFLFGIEMIIWVIVCFSLIISGIYLFTYMILATFFILFGLTLKARVFIKDKEVLRKNILNILTVLTDNEVIVLNNLEKNFIINIIGNKMKTDPFYKNMLFLSLKNRDKCIVTSVKDINTFRIDIVDLLERARTNKKSMDMFYRSINAYEKLQI